MSRLIDADLIQYEMMLSAKGNGMYEEVMVAYKSQINDLPTIEERKTVSNEEWTKVRGGWTNQPERNRGKWLETDSHEPCWFKCNQCGRLYDFLDNYCPNCGAKMEI